MRNDMHMVVNQLLPDRIVARTTGFDESSQQFDCKTAAL
jgi:hypothetical protein